MMSPLIVINFKTYENATGEEALEIAKIAQKISDSKKVGIILAVQPTDIYPISQEVKIPVYSQHIDLIDYGAHTGSILPEAVKEAGAKGTLINHSEKRLNLDVIESLIKKAKKIDLTTIVCANTAEQAKSIAVFRPDYVAVEPPELIGGKVSVSNANPEIIKDTVTKVKSVSFGTEVLVGAGVKTKEDVDKALLLGAKGVLLASAVAKASNTEQAIMKLVE